MRAVTVNPSAGCWLAPMALAVRKALTGGYCLKGQIQSFIVYLRRGTSVLSPSLESIALFVRRAAFCIIAALNAVENRGGSQHRSASTRRGRTKSEIIYLARARCSG